MGLQQDQQAERGAVSRRRNHGRSQGRVSRHGGPKSTVQIYPLVSLCMILQICLCRWNAHTITGDESYQTQASGNWTGARQHCTNIKYTNCKIERRVYGPGQKPLAVILSCSSFFNTSPTVRSNSPAMALCFDPGSRAYVSQRSPSTTAFTGT